jgi:predicted acyltransferase (DUF342 family)
MIVIVIIGILAAIGILVASTQQRAAIEATVKHDVKANSAYMAPGLNGHLYSAVDKFMLSGRATEDNVLGYDVNNLGNEACVWAYHKFSDTDIVSYKILSSTGKMSEGICPDLGNSITSNGSLKGDGIEARPQGEVGGENLAAINLGAAIDFSILAGSAITNGGATHLSGNLGISPGETITGFPAGTLDGEVHANTTAAQTAQKDFIVAYTDAATRVPTKEIGSEIGNRTLPPGIYHSSSAIGLTGVLVLDALGDPNAVFIFQTDSAFNTAADSEIRLVNGANVSNVFWQVGSSATLGGASAFRGNIMAYVTITVGADTFVRGRLLAHTGAVTVSNNFVTDILSSDTQPVNLGTAGNYSVLSGTAVTSDGATKVNQNVGVAPGTAITGFADPSTYLEKHANDANAIQAQSDYLSVYTDLSGRTPTDNISGQLGGRVITPGVYYSNAALQLTGNLVLDAKGDPNAIFIFQVDDELTTAAGSNIVFSNGASAKNVYWQIGAATTLGADSQFHGTILGYNAVTIGANTSIQGHVFSRNGAITLSNNLITS